MDFGFCSKTAVFWTKLWIVDTEFALNQLNLSNLKIGRCTDRSAMTVASVMFCFGYACHPLTGIRKKLMHGGGPPKALVPKNVS